MYGRNARRTYPKVKKRRESLKSLISKIYVIKPTETDIIAEKIRTENQKPVFYQVCKIKDVTSKKFLIGLTSIFQDIWGYAVNTLRYKINDPKNIETQLKDVSKKRNKQWKIGIILGQDNELLSADGNLLSAVRKVYGSFCLFRNKYESPGNTKGLGNYAKLIQGESVYEPIINKDIILAHLFIEENNSYTANIIKGSKLNTKKQEVKNVIKISDNEVEIKINADESIDAKLFKNKNKYFKQALKGNYSEAHLLINDIQEKNLKLGYTINKIDEEDEAEGKETYSIDFWTFN